MESIIMDDREIDQFISDALTFVASKNIPPEKAAILFEMTSDYIKQELGMKIHSVETIAGTYNGDAH